MRTRLELRLQNRMLAVVSASRLELLLEVREVVC